MKAIPALACMIVSLTSLTASYCNETFQDSVVISCNIPGSQKDLFARTVSKANESAVRLTQAGNILLDSFDVYYNLDEDPVTCVFEYGFTSNGMGKYLTLAVSLRSESPRVEYYYFDKTSEKVWLESLKTNTEKKIIICNQGTFVRKNENEYIKFPEGTIYTKVRLLEEQGRMARKIIQESQGGKGSGTELTDTGKAGTLAETIIDGVPNYIWYLNCGLTTNTMITGYWDDKGYGNLIPGGNSKDGHYWAFTEEECFFGEMTEGMDPLTYYAQAKEYGNTYIFSNHVFSSASYTVSGFWNHYMKMIDSTKNPMEVTWMGPPYGAHATVGIGYNTDGDQRFLILNDTWRNVPSYVSYDQYYSSVSGFSHFSPSTKAPAETEPTSNTISSGSFSLEAINLDISPSLEPSAFAYHSFELADLNGDNSEDLIICDFRNNTGSSGLKVYYKNGETYSQDTRFKPGAQWFECANISRTFDFDKDGDKDLAVTGYWSTVALYINARDSIRQKPLVIDSIGRGFIDLQYGDYDLDGYIDLVSTSVDGQIRLYHNNGGRSFTQTHTISLNSQSCKVKLTDINKDGYPDLIASKRSGTVVMFYNSGGRFNTTPDFSPSGHGGLSFDVADLNKDSWEDIITSSDGKILVYYNRTGSFSDDPIHINDNLNSYPKDFLATDLDTDGYPEIIVANYNRANFILGNNQGQLDPSPVWESVMVDPTVNIRLFENSKGEKTLLFGKSRGGNLEFYKVNLLSGSILAITPTSLNVDYFQGKRSFNLISNTSWKISSDVSWLTVNQNTGSGNTALTVSFTENTSGIARVAKISISGSGAGSVTATINQAGRSDILPILTTSNVSKITPTSALCGGTISSQGVATVTARGVCWSTGVNPTVTLSTKTIDGAGTGTFMSNINGLADGVTYYVRAYATNSAGTGYGDNVSFKYEQNLIAHYPLLNDGIDETGNNPEMTLTNTPFQNGGIYSNGVWLSSTAVTPPISKFNFSSFTVSADFMVTEYLYQPVFVCGTGCRWLGFYLRSDGTVDLLYNNNNHLGSNKTYDLNQWHNARITYDGQTAKMFIDNELVCSVAIRLEYSVCGSFDTMIGTVNNSNGNVFKGYFKELKVYDNSIGKSLEVNPAYLEIQTNDIESGSFSVISNTSWTVSSSESWLNINTPGGTGNGTVTFTSQANASALYRIATLTISGAGVESRSITVLQYGTATVISDTEDEEVVIYPNPVKTTLYFKGVPVYTRMLIYDLSGERIIDTEIRENSFNISTLQNGLYIIELLFDGKTVIRKIIKY